MAMHSPRRSSSKTCPPDRVAFASLSNNEPEDESVEVEPDTSSFSS